MKTTAPSPKKPYQKPTLRVYGDIKDITKSHGNVAGQNDGGTGSMIKTS